MDLEFINKLNKPKIKCDCSKCKKTNLKTTMDQFALYLFLSNRDFVRS